MAYQCITYYFLNKLNTEDRYDGAIGKNIFEDRPPSKDSIVVTNNLVVF